ncbi:Uncharacterised protein [Streptococcus pneumoniae]|nr:Uncharacterised protein [Streptococcus pneumoniae]CJA63138.1 Uncharacterised protein [Streptococcus pneumoniae]
MCSHDQLVHGNEYLEYVPQLQILSLVLQLIHGGYLRNEVFHRERFVLHALLLALLLSYNIYKLDHALINLHIIFYKYLNALFGDMVQIHHQHQHLHPSPYRAISSILIGFLLHQPRYVLHQYLQYE